MDLIIVGIALPWIVVAMGCWLGHQLLRQNGRLLLRLEALEQHLGQPGQPAAPSAPPGLPVGSMAPEFELPDLKGAPTSLSQLRGRRLLLIFFNPRCGFCAQMAEDLAALPVDGTDGRPLPLIISTGAVEENRELVAAHHIRCPVLLQDAMEIAARYQAHGTPIGYLIDEQGRIASEIAVGAEALLALADPAGRAAVNGNGHREHHGNRSLADSKINRSGLPVGTLAPGFALPGLHGEEVSLDQYRGRRVLLVFSDPNCSPCHQLLPRLEQFHRRSGDVQVLMVSRGDAEANRRKAEEHGLTFPILLQRQWEVSRAYAMFATPIAYLIDGTGTIADNVATGAQPILSLLERTTASQAASPRGSDAGAGCKRERAIVAKRTVARR